MHILYLHQYFRKPQEPGSHRSFYIAQALCQAGHHVTILTATNHHKSFSEEILPNLQVHYLAVPYKQSMGFWKRIFAFLKFAYKAIYKANSISYDKIYASSTPLSIGLVALWLRLINKKKYLFEVRDLWPQVPIEMGILKNPILKKLSYYVEKKIYQYAEKIVTLSPPMQKYVSDIVPKKPVICVPNIADCSFFEPCSPTPNAFRIIYMGSIGRANGLERVILCAEKCPFVSFWIVGDGAKKKEIEELVKQKQIVNVKFFDSQNKSSLKDLLQQVEAAIISFADYKILETCSPNKFFDALAAGKVCITNTGGWIKDLIESHHCGFYARTAEEFATKLQTLIQHPEQIAQMQANARKLAETHFNKTHLCKKIVDFLENSD